MIARIQHERMYGQHYVCWDCTYVDLLLRCRGCFTKLIMTVCAEEHCRMLFSYIQRYRSLLQHVSASCKAVVRSMYGRKVSSRSRVLVCALTSRTEY